MIDVVDNEFVLVEAGVVRSQRTRPLAERLLELHGGICEVMESLAPEVMALEEVFSHYERPKTAILMGHARGVINLAAAQIGIEVRSYAPNQVKQIMTGNGHASKVQMQLAVANFFGWDTPPTPHDVADALSIALCHAFTSRNPLLQS